METSTRKKVKHHIVLSQQELGDLVYLLKSWKREVGDRLPTGPNTEHAYLIDELDNLFKRGAM